MKPPPFDYVVPASIEAAVAALAQAGPDAKILAGGQSLVPLMALRMARPALLLDVNGLAALAHMRVEGDLLVIGATTRQRAVERDAGLARRCPVLGDAVPMIGHVAIRNRGTVGGSVAHADPAAEWPALLLALDGEVRVAAPGGNPHDRGAGLLRGPVHDRDRARGARGRGRGPRPARRRLGRSSSSPAATGTSPWSARRSCSSPVRTGT